MGRVSFLEASLVNEDSARACAQKCLCDSFQGFMRRLSTRLQFIYNHLLPGFPVWDFCCDHGYLGLNAFESGAFPCVYFVDQVTEIIEQLQNRFKLEYSQLQTPSQAHFIACSGENLSQEVEGNLVVSGVGAFTIFDIIQSIYSRQLLMAERLILVPQRDEEKLVHFLNELPKFNDIFALEQFDVMERARCKKVLVYSRL